MQLVFTDEYSTLFFLANGLAVLLYLAARKKNRQRAMKLGNFETLEKVTNKSFLKSNNLLLILRLIAFTSLVIAISNPVLITEQLTADSDYVVAIDSSVSMLTADVEPSRFEAAKQTSSDFVSSLPNGTSSGALLYSGEVEQLSSVTSDTESVVSEISDAEVSENAGTAMADAVRASATMLTGSSNTREVILIGDGDSNIGNLSEAAEYARRNNVSVNTVGVGSSDNSIGFETVNGQNGSYYSPGFEGDKLRMVANSTNGTYVRAMNQSAIGEAFTDIGVGETRRDMSRVFVLLALLLLLGEWIIGSTRYSILP